MGKLLSCKGDFLLAFVLSLLHVALVSLVYDKVPEPYMDEIFHVQQTRSYCAGNYSWNAKITTPPALYVVSLPFCGLERYANSLIMFFAVLAFARYRRLFNQDNVCLSVMSCLCLPVLLHSSLLFYTDLLSVSAVVMAFTCGSPLISALFFALSILTRQTNILWAGLFAAMRLSHSLDSRRPVHSALKGLFPLTPFIALAAGFVMFIYWNGGIVLGDASAHQPQLHLAQLFYCSLFMAVHSWPQVLPYMTNVLWRDVFSLSSLVLLALSGVSLNYFAFDHPYLLADNRHVSSALWRRFLSNPMYRQALAPACVLAFAFIRRSVKSTHSPLERALFTLCTAAVLVPAHLLEFRYFIIPYVLWRLSIRTRNLWLCLLELCTQLAVFGVLFIAFLYKPFEWSHEPGAKQRYMW